MLVVVALAASDPPTASVLPPGAGNEDEDVLDTDEQDPEKGEWSNLEQAGPDGQLDAAPVSADGDGGGPAILLAGRGHDRVSLREIPAVSRPQGLRSLRANRAAAQPGG